MFTQDYNSLPEYFEKFRTGIILFRTFLVSLCW